jgi:GT2 family glycosyltransferase
MNTALLCSRGEVVLFLDDDVDVQSSIVGAHGAAYGDRKVAVVVGQIIQPWEDVLPPAARVGDGMRFRFNSSERSWITSVMAGNMSVRRETAIALGGFDENFVQVAYRFEAEFAERVREAGYTILFEPAASLRHLKIPHGGTRSFGHHLTTAKPSHAVGEYYYLLRRWWKLGRLWQLAQRPFKAVSTQHHLRRPWWIPVTLTAELLGFFWGLALTLRGPRYLKRA